MKPPQFEVRKSDGTLSGPWTDSQLVQGLQRDDFLFSDSYRRIGKVGEWKELGALWKWKRKESFLWLSAGSIIFVGFGLSVLYIWWWCFQIARETETWPSIPGKITVSSVENRMEGEEGKTFAPKVIYRYEVAGKKFSNSMIYPLWIRGGSEAWAQSVVQRHPIGPCLVYYRPGHSSVSVLERGMTVDTRRILAGILGLMGALFYFGALSGWSAVMRPSPEKLPPGKPRPTGAGILMGTTLVIFPFLICLLMASRLK